MEIHNRIIYTLTINSQERQNVRGLNIEASFFIGKIYGCCQM